MINDTQVSLDADQAQQLLQQLAVCLDTLTHNHPARAALGSTLIITTMEPADVERFLADLAHTYRYLDARLATARRTRKEAANQNRVGPHQTSTVGPNGLVILNSSTPSSPTSRRIRSASTPTPPNSAQCLPPRSLSSTSRPSKTPRLRRRC